MASVGEVPHDRRRSIGGAGERFAERHLIDAGYRVLDRNYRTRYGELDLVLVSGGCLVFCEVKTRSGGSRHGPDGPLEGIGVAKRRRLRRMASEWLYERAAASGAGRTSAVRFDAVGVTLGPAGELATLDHVEDAFS